MKTYELKVAATMILGPHSTIKHPGTWALRRIHDGTFPAYRVGRKWIMSLAQIDAARRAA
jgi:hypothetical protein